jgi:hypothetical protein
LWAPEQQYDSNHATQERTLEAVSSRPLFDAGVAEVCIRKRSQG